MFCADVAVFQTMGKTKGLSKDKIVELHKTVGKTKDIKRYPGN